MDLGRLLNASPDDDDHRLSSSNMVLGSSRSGGRRRHRFSPSPSQFEASSDEDSTFHQRRRSTRRKSPSRSLTAGKNGRRPARPPTTACSSSDEAAQQHVANSNWTELVTAINGALDQELRGQRTSGFSSPTSSDYGNDEDLSASGTFESESSTGRHVQRYRRPQVPPDTYFFYPPSGTLIKLSDPPHPLYREGVHELLCFPPGSWIGDTAPWDKTAENEFVRNQECLPECGYRGGKNIKPVRIREHFIKCRHRRIEFEKAEKTDYLGLLCSLQIKTMRMERNEIETRASQILESASDSRARRHFYMSSTSYSAPTSPTTTAYRSSDTPTYRSSHSPTRYYSTPYIPLPSPSASPQSVVGGSGSRPYQYQHYFDRQAYSAPTFYTPLPPPTQPFYIPPAPAPRADGPRWSPASLYGYSTAPPSQPSFSTWSTGLQLLHTDGGTQQFAEPTAYLTHPPAQKRELSPDSSPATAKRSKTG